MLLKKQSLDCFFVEKHKKNIYNNIIGDTMKDKKGFTLIEVISVLIILAILASLASVQYATTIKKSRERLNAEQKSRIVETAKNISLNNRDCLTTAKNNVDGVQIALTDMISYGYISNSEYKDLETNTLLNSCVIIKWDSQYSKFDYEYSDTCPNINTCTISAENDKVLISQFVLGEKDSNYTSQQEIPYHLEYSTTINAEYCVTLGSEASCSWKKLDMNSKKVDGTLKLKEVENLSQNIVHLYVRNNNKIIINKQTSSVIYDNVAPNCNWLTPSNSYIKNSSTTELILKCEDAAGIKNSTLSKDAIIISNDSLININDAIVEEVGNSKNFKFTVTGLTGNGSITLSLSPNTISDKAGNIINYTIKSNVIILDNVIPEGKVSIKNGSIYTNSENVELEFTDVSSDIASVCISNIDNNCTNYKSYKSIYSHTIPLGDGSKTIYVSLKDKAGNVNKINTTIKLDKTEPTCRLVESPNSYYLKNGSYNEYVIRCYDLEAIGEYTLTSANFSTDNKLVNVELTKFVTNEATVKVTALTGDGKTKIYLNPGSILDSAGNTNTKQIEIASLTIDNTPPLNNSILINYGATITNNKTLILTLNSSDNVGGYYCLNKTNKVTDCIWNSYTKEGTYTLNTSAINQTENHTIYAFFKDIAGNISTTSVEDSINYNSEAVACILQIKNGKVIINSSYSSLADIPYSWDNQNWTINNEIPLESSDRTYRAFIKDSAGNINYCDISYIAN